MRNFVSTIVFGLALAGAGLLGANVVYAQVTNQALQLTPTQATALWRECYQDENKTSVFSCRLVSQGVTTACTRDAAIAGDRCIFTYSDNSRIEADPNFFAGATYRNYDSGGNLVGSNNTGVGGTSEGTLEGSTAYDSGGHCGVTNIGCHLQKLPGMLLVGIAFLFLYLAGLILFLAGTLFNWVVLRTVFQFGDYFGTSEGMLVAWGVMRDIANIGLLFAFVLIGIMLILNVDRYGGSAASAKKAIPRLIIFAVLLNFSLFASQAVIDVANAFGSSFTTLAQENCSEQVTTQQGGGQSLEDCATNNGISGRIMQAAGLTGIWDDGRRDINSALNNTGDRPYSYAVSLIMLSIFVLVSALVLLAGAIMLIIRVVVLSFLMVTSPIGFAGMVIPGLGKMAGQWWSALLNQAFFAPVYLLLIFLSIKLTENLMNGEASLANAVIANAGDAVSGNVQVVMVFLIVIGFMLGSLILANKMGAVGAKFAISSASALTVGSAGFVGRRTLGVGSRRLMQTSAVQNWVRKDGVGSRAAYNLLNKGATSSWSLRTGMNSALGAAGMANSVGMGAANKRVAGGIVGIEAAQTKERQNIAANIKQTKREEGVEKTATETKEQAETVKKVFENKVVEEKKNLDAHDKDAKEQVTALKSENDTKARVRLSTIQTKQQEAENLRVAALTSNSAEVKASINTELANTQAALNALEEQHREELDREAAAVIDRQNILATQRAVFEKNLATFDTEIKRADLSIKQTAAKIDGGVNPITNKVEPGVSLNAAKRTYGEKLQKGSVMQAPFVGDGANRAAARNILKEIKKTDKDRLVETLSKFEKEAAAGK